MVSFVALADVLPKHVLARILCKMPAVLKLSPGEVRWHVQSLATVFSAAQLHGLLPKVPTILAMSPFTLWSNLEVLRATLDVSLEQVRAEGYWA